VSSALPDSERLARAGLPDGFGAAAILLAGIMLLLLRPLALGRPDAVFVLGATYVLVGGLSLATPVPRPEPALLHPLLVLAVGVGAFVLSGSVAGPRIPLPLAPHMLVLNTVAAVSEEAFFHRFLFGRLARYGPATAILVTALLFAAIHVPIYGMPVLWVDLGAGLVLSWQRWASGRWTTPAATHVLANFLAVMR
jgi:membrane protease YdiL (CAAX protease family)